MPQKLGIVVDKQIVIVQKKIQIEAARIVTELSIYAGFYSIYKETGWETLSRRREVK
jgi:hypothetical protein